MVKKLGEGANLTMSADRPPVRVYASDGMKPWRRKWQ
jgi:hypothetical protein